MVKQARWRWLLGALLIGWIGYDLYTTYRAGIFSRPTMPEGAFSLSFKNGFRAIMVDLPNVKPERKYLGIPATVPSWYKKSWSFCHAPTQEELDGFPELNLGPGARLEAVCRLDLKTENIVRGVIASVPNL